MGRGESSSREPGDPAVEPPPSAPRGRLGDPWRETPAPARGASPAGAGARPGLTASPRAVRPGVCEATPEGTPPPGHLPRPPPLAPPRVAPAARGPRPRYPLRRPPPPAPPTGDEVRGGGSSGLRASLGSGGAGVPGKAPSARPGPRVERAPERALSRGTPRSQGPCAGRGSRDGGVGHGAAARARGGGARGRPSPAAELRAQPIRGGGWAARGADWLAPAS